LSAANLGQLNTAINDLDSRITQITFNVQHYGATGNGATDDRTAVSAALAAAASGGIVYFPPGTYKLPVSTPYVINPQLVSLQGSGPTSILDFSSASASEVIDIASNSGDHQVRYPLAHLALSGPTASNTTVNGVVQGGGSNWAPHCVFTNVRLIGFAHQWTMSSNVWSTKWYNCHFENSAASSFRTDPAGSGLGENSSFFGCLFSGNLQESIILQTPGTDLAFFGCQFDYCGRAINHSYGHIICVGCHFEADNTNVATGANEYILMNRSGSQDLPLLELTGCTYFPAWTARQATITLTGTVGSCELVVNGGQVSTGSSYTVLTFVQDTGTNPADITINNLKYSQPTTNAPLNLVTASGAFAITPSTTGQAVPLAEGLTGGTIALTPLWGVYPPTVTQVGTAGSTSYWYKWVAQIVQGSGVGETAPSSAIQTSTGNATLNTINYNSVAGIATPGATSYRLLKSTNGTTYTSLANGLATPSYKDQGQSTSAYTATTFVNPTPSITAGGIILRGVGANNNVATNYGSECALFTDNDSRLFLMAKNGPISILPGGQGVSTGQVTVNTSQTTFNGAVAHAVNAQTLSSNGAVTLNANLGDVQAVTLQANATSSSITNPSTGQRMTIRWIQDATGGRTVSWPTNCKFAGGSAPSSTTASKATSATFEYDGTNWIEVCRAVAVG
jgi:hypothetical protein